MEKYMKQTTRELERHFQSLISKFEAKMEFQMKEIRDSFALEIGNVITLYERERQARLDLEKKTSGMEIQIANIHRTVKDLEVTVVNTQTVAAEATAVVQNADLSTVHHPESRRFLIKGLEYNSTDRGHDLKTRVQDILDAINTNVRIRKVEPLQSRRNMGSVNNSPGLILVTMDNTEDRTKVMRAKGKLNKNDTYKGVYLFPDRPLNERIIEGRLRKIVASIPNLEWNKGRIQQKQE